MGILNNCFMDLIIIGVHTAVLDNKLNNSSKRKRVSIKGTNLVISLYLAARNCFAASVNGRTASAIRTLEGSSRYSKADSGVIGKLHSSLLQYFMQDATSNLSAAMSTSSNPGAVFVVNIFLYINFRSSVNAASSDPWEQIKEKTIFCVRSDTDFKATSYEKQYLIHNHQNQKSRRKIL